MIIPPKYLPRLLTEDDKEGYLSWSLDFFTKTDILQNPTIDITLQLEVTEAYKIYETIRNEKSTFFAFLVWNLVKVLPNHFCFNLRLLQHDWYILDNPPIVIPVAVEGKQRFSEMLLENISQLSLNDFFDRYRSTLDNIRGGKGTRVEEINYLLSCFIGNLPNLRFTGLTLHWQKNFIEGQPLFYFGQRYWENDKLYIPLAVKLHHSITDPFVYNLLIQDFQNHLISIN
ncbi:CatA-like O-acetyltransferase [Geminocystis sp. NIES-3709]|uniref:CatA-like O-acetyltransferase n=1 Tax=Geminocystis sp. NIES-3709 TaxID=1617448 RepID=UPI0005FC747E|nr:CatA-like O-acetyltransferase [Geminocystis sp. NIES-3709]BAQ66809.1 hypothetical protein GM3709_3574 [Geminocystis sp. NIES-3709]